MPRINVNGVELHYEQRGEGEDLVLIHGLGTGSADWLFQLPALAPYFRITAPCLRGFGESERGSAVCSVAQFAADVRGLLDALGIERCHMAGVSMGGAVGFQFAVDHAERLRSLAVINSQPSFEPDTLKKRLQYLARWCTVRLLGMQRVEASSLRRNFPDPGQAALREQLRGRFRNDPATYLAALDALMGWTVADRLGRIEVPVLFIASEFDYSSPREKAGFAARLADGRVELLVGAHHSAHLERADEVNEILLAFLREPGGA